MAVADPAETMHIVVARLDGEKVEVDIAASETVDSLKLLLQELLAVPPELQSLLRGKTLLKVGSAKLQDEAVTEGSTLTLLVKDPPLVASSGASRWNIEGNPEKQQVAGSGGEVIFAKPTNDCVILVTEAPVTTGVHYFEFANHRKGDEQWLGITPCANRVGSECVYDSMMPLWAYYAGQGQNGLGSLVGGGIRSVECTAPGVKDGDVVGMYLDMTKGEVAFAHNGALVGSMSFKEVAAGKPMWLTTTLDRQDDHVVLRELPITECPAALIEKLGGQKV